MEALYSENMKRVFTTFSRANLVKRAFFFDDYITVFVIMVKERKRKGIALSSKPLEKRRKEGQI
jgi:hypothetical protein